MPQELQERAKNIKALVLDSDGVIFTGHVIEGVEGPLAKIRSHADGQGISLLRGIGVVVACLTGESGINASFLEGLVKKWNNLPSVASGKWKPVMVFSGVERQAKVNTAKEWLLSHGLTFEDCAAMGDDMTDYEILKEVRLAAAPAQAEEIIKKRVHFVAKRRGGDGAIRDLANLILEAQGVDVGSLALR